MMRAVVGLLIAANAILAAMQAGWLPQPWGRRPDIAMHELNPDRIRLLPITPSTAKSTTPPAVHANATAPTPASSPANAASTPTAATATACLDIGPFKSPNAAAQAKGLIAALLPAGQGEIQTINSETRWWVHMPDTATRSQLDQQIAQLRSAGISEYYILNTDGKPGFTLSLGLFNDRARAQRFIDALAQRGLAPQLDERPGTANRVTYRVTNIDSNVTRQLQTLTRQQWPGLGAQACAGTP